MSPGVGQGESGVALAVADRLSREALICVDWLAGDPENPLGPGPYPSYRAGLDARVADAVAAIEQMTGRAVRLRECARPTPGGVPASPGWPSSYWSR